MEYCLIMGSGGRFVVWGRKPLAGEVVGPRAIELPPPVVKIPYPANGQSYFMWSRSLEIRLPTTTPGRLQCIELTGALENGCPSNLKLGQTKNVSLHWLTWENERQHLRYRGDGLYLDLRPCWLIFPSLHSWGCCLYKFALESFGFLSLFLQ